MICCLTIAWSAVEAAMLLLLLLLLLQAAGRACLARFSCLCCRHACGRVLLQRWSTDGLS
jgi:hypothetical protein